MIWECQDNEQIVSKSKPSSPVIFPKRFAVKQFCRLESALYSHFFCFPFPRKACFPFSKHLSIYALFRGFVPPQFNHLVWLFARFWKPKARTVFKWLIMEKLNAISAPYKTVVQRGRSPEKNSRTPKRRCRTPFAVKMDAPWHTERDPHSHTWKLFCIRVDDHVFLLFGVSLSVTQWRRKNTQLHITIETKKAPSHIQALFVCNFGTHLLEATGPIDQDIFPSAFYPSYSRKKMGTIIYFRICSIAVRRDSIIIFYPLSFWSVINCLDIKTGLTLHQSVVILYFWILCKFRILKFLVCTFILIQWDHIISYIQSTALLWGFIFLVKVRKHYDSGHPNDPQINFPRFASFVNRGITTGGALPDNPTIGLVSPP